MKVPVLLELTPGDILYDNDNAVFYISSIDGEENKLKGVMALYEVDGFVIVFKVKTLSYSDVLCSWEKRRADNILPYYAKVEAEFADLKRHIKFYEGVR